MTKQVIICVDDETTVLRSLKAELKEAIGNDYLIEIAESGADALELLAELLEDNYEIPLIISDYIMPDMKGDELLRCVHKISPKTLKVMLTGQATIEGVGNAIKYAKLYRYISKPWQSEDLRLTITEAIYSYAQDKKLVEQNAQLQKMNEELAQLNAELSQLNQSFSRFVPRQFLQFLDKASIIDIRLGDQVQKEMSVLFADIRSFTSLSETMTPLDNFKFINAYLSRMEPAIIENHGFIDKYIGDAIMALFSGYADNAVKAGIAMLNIIAEYNQYRTQAGYTPIHIGIGINTGSLMLGIVGGENRMDGTVISDAVNLAARIEELTKEYGASLLISHQTFLQLQEPDAHAIRPIASVKVKGKSEKVSVYEVFDADAPEVHAGKLATLPTFTAALSLYNQGKLDEARNLFADCLRQNPLDRVAKIYLERVPIE
jgi:class 3 adenylate cyclase/FixJ family two-component response regulator